MPRKGLYIPIKDRQTGQSYMMPWHDATAKPSDYDIESYVYDQKNKSMWQKANEATSDIFSRNMQKVTEPLMQYGEGGELNIPIGPLAPIARALGGSKYIKSGSPYLTIPRQSEGPQSGIGKTLSDIDRRAAMYTGAFGESLGEQADIALTSPVGAATTLAGPVGRGIQGIGGAGRLGQVGSAVTRIPQVVGGANILHGGRGLLETYRDPNSELGDYAGPLMEMTMGGVGLMSGGPRAKPTTPPGPMHGPWQASPYSPGLRPKPRLGLPSGPEVIDVMPENAQIWQRPRQLPPSRRTKYVTPEGDVMPDLGDITSAEIVADTPRGKGRGSTVLRPTNVDPMSRLEDLTGTGITINPLEVNPDLAKWQAKARARTPGAEPPLSIGRGSVVEPAVRLPGGRPHSVAMGRSVVETPLAATADEALSTAQQTIKGRRAQQASEASRFASQTGARGRRGLGKLFREEIGEVTTSPLEPLGEKLGEGIEWLKTGVGKAKTAASGARSKFLSNIEEAEKRGVFGAAQGPVSSLRKGVSALTGKDVTSASLKGLTRSGWVHLDSFGEPGKRLSKLLQRERIDVGIEKAAAEKKGGYLVDEDGKPINEIGGLIYKRNKEHIEQLISQIPDTGDQAKARALVQKWAGHGANLEKPFAGGYNSIKQLEALSKLSQFAIGNTAGLGTTAMRNKLSTVFKATKRVLTDFEGAFDEAKESGMLGKLESAMRADTGEGGLSKLADKMFKISASENRLRSISTLAGKETARDLFAEIKANPALRNNKYKMKQLDDLLLEDDLDSLFKQDKLTDHQLRRAGGRMNEITQGTAESIDLPPQWTGHPIMDLLTQFKKYGFMQSRNMSEAIKANPYRALPTLALAFPALGEAIGDAKGIVKGGVKAALQDKDFVDSIAKELEDRGSGMSRVLNNAGQAWAFGIFDDLRRGAERGPSGLATSLAGPFVDDLSEAAYGLTEAAKKGQTYHLKRQAARTVPYIGTALAGTIKGSYAGRQGRRSNKRQGRPRREE